MAAHPASDLHAFLIAASPPRHMHASGSLERAQQLLLADPTLGEYTIFGAAITGNAHAVERLLSTEPAAATAVGGPYGWDALTYLCFSRFLRSHAAQDPQSSERFTRSAELLLNAGASATTGFLDDEHQPTPMFESALYGAAGLAHHAPITKLLLERGADPNDDEVPYHAPETFDLSAMEALLDSGRLTAGSLATMLLRKADWHDHRGVERLLADGVDPNEPGRWPHSPFLHALHRDNRLPTLEAMLDHGADPLRIYGHTDGYALAIWLGRVDVLAAYHGRGITRDLTAVEAIATACTQGDPDRAAALLAHDRNAAECFAERAAGFLARCALTGNERAVSALLAIGVSARSPYADGDGYFGLAPDGTALHAAAWLARHGVVRLLLAAGADPSARNRAGRTPLEYAVKACVDSYWSNRRAPDSVAALLAAGADARMIRVPTGYDDIDRLLG